MGIRIILPILLAKCGYAYYKVPNELVWHRDREDRTVVTLSGTGWMLQVENKLPVALSEGSSHLIPKNTYHRIIKGTTKLVVEITEENTALRSYIREVLTESKKSDAAEKKPT